MGVITPRLKQYTVLANPNTIGAAADSHIGENLMGGAEKPHPIPPRHAFNTQMKKKDDDISRRDRVTDYSVAAIEQAESYCRAHPGSSAAVRRPQLFFRGELWIAVLGRSVEEGIVGIGPTVAAALRAFDVQYLAGLRPPVETGSKSWCATAIKRRSPAHPAQP